ncbi:MAG: hypothetical protein FWD14_03265 [Treponema sp.]|nr:hypothetical protein [Treponema sp.]
MKKLLFLLIFIPVLALAEPMYSPTWGFFMDLPEGYEYVDGDARDRFSFAGLEGLRFDLVVYNGQYGSMLELANDVNRRLSNRGDVDFFTYRGKQALLMTLLFGDFFGWGLAVELEKTPAGSQPVLLALAYSPADRKEMEIFHASALDSISPTAEDLFYPGILTEYGNPRGELKRTPLAINGLTAMIRENDAQASQGFIEREFKVMNAYLNTTYLQAAAIRYYRSIYRDSWDRLFDAASVITHHFGGHLAVTDEQKRVFAERVLSFVQGFRYERDLSGSDFLNLVSLISEGTGSCDNRSMLYTIILAHAGIRAGLMLSHYYSHAMTLVDVTGPGSRVPSHDIMWVVAETTTKIDIGYIDSELSDMRYWFAIMFR